MAYQDKVLQNRFRSRHHPRVQHNSCHLTKARGSCIFVYEFGIRRHMTSSKLTKVTSQCSCHELKEKGAILKLQPKPHSICVCHLYSIHRTLLLTRALHIEARDSLCACTKSCAIFSTSLLAGVITGTVSGRCSCSTCHGTPSPCSPLAVPTIT